jgi:hypothetical protein
MPAFRWENVKEKDCLLDLDVNKRIILKLIQKYRCKGVDYIQFSKSRDQWRTVVMAVMDIRILSIPGNFWTSS